MTPAEHTAALNARLAAIDPSRRARREAVKLSYIAEVSGVETAIPTVLAWKDPAELGEIAGLLEVARAVGRAEGRREELAAHMRAYVPAIDAGHLARQRAWSLETFGPGPRTLGVIDHIRKELAEIQSDPSDLGEWVDVIILALDGAWRAGWEPQEIIDAVKAKQAHNEARAWPDWRTCSQDEAIEHVRSAEGGA